MSLVYEDSPQTWAEVQMVVYIAPDAVHMVLPNPRKGEDTAEVYNSHWDTLVWAIFKE